MRFRITLVALLFLSFFPALAQQSKPALVAEGGPPDERGSTRVLYWNEAQNRAAGQFAVNYGRPVWKKDYEDPAKFDGMTKGKTWRLGSNFWTDLDTSLPLKISGRSVPVGHYYLGLHRSPDGLKWSLVLIDPAKVRTARLDAFEIQKAPIAFAAAMFATKAVTKSEKLTIKMSYPKDDIRKVMLEVAWGNLALAAPIDVTVSD